MSETKKAENHKKKQKADKAVDVQVEEPENLEENENFDNFDDLDDGAEIEIDQDLGPSPLINHPLRPGNRSYSNIMTAGFTNTNNANSILVDNSTGNEPIGSYNSQSNIPIRRRSPSRDENEVTPRRESPNRYNRFQRFIKSFSSQPPMNYYKAPPAPSDGRKCLVLDMDETLIHCSAFPPHPSVTYFTLSETEYVYLRPGLNDFLQYAQENFEVFIYTFAERDYAELVLNQIAPNIDEDHRLYRDSCIVKKDLIIKDLDMLNRKKSKLIFVDDNDKALKVHKENTIIIPMWKGTPNDHALVEWLIPILETCKNANDTRTVIKNIKNQTRRYTT